MKKCNVCKHLLDVAMFHKDKSKKGGLCGTCKACAKNRSDKWKERNREHVENYFKDYYQKVKQSKTDEDRKKDKIKEKKYLAKYPERRKARLMVNNYVRAGKLKKLDCQVCSDKNSHGHHPDYSKPLEVIWLCPKHHREWHRINKEEYERVNNGNY